MTKNAWIICLADSRPLALFCQNILRINTSLNSHQVPDWIFAQQASAELFLTILCHPTVSISLYSDNTTLSGKEHYLLNRAPENSSKLHEPFMWPSLRLAFIILSKIYTILLNNEDILIAPNTNRSLSGMCGGDAHTI